MIGTRFHYWLVGIESNMLYIDTVKNGTQPDYILAPMTIGRPGVNSELLARFKNVYA